MNQNYNYSEIPTGTIPTGYIHTGYIPVGKIPVGNIPGSSQERAKLLAQEKQDRLNHHLKGLSDIVLGNPITGTKQLQVTLEDNGLDWLKYIPLINRAAGFVILTKERVIDPFIKGQPGIAVLNTLESVGTDLDVLGNIVKSFMPAAGGGTWDDVLASMGWLEGEYRKYYQYDTGSFLVDFALELVSDPLNWIDFGLGEVAGDSMTKLATKYGDDIINGLQEGGKVSNKISKNLIEKAIRGDSDAYIRLEKQIANNIKVRKSTLQTLINETQDAATIRKLTKQINKLDNLSVGNSKIISQIIADARLTTGYKAYKYISKPITKAAQYGNLGSGGSILLYNKVIKPTGKALYNNLITRLKNVEFTNTVMGMTQQLNTVKNVTKAKTKAAYKDEVQKAIKFINETIYGNVEKVKLNDDAIDILWQENLNKLTFKQRMNPKTVANTFRNYLLETSNITRWLKTVDASGKLITDTKTIKSILDYIEQNNKTVQQGLVKSTNVPTILDPLLNVIEKQEIENYSLDIVTDINIAQYQIGEFVKQVEQQYTDTSDLIPTAIQQLKYFKENILQGDLTVFNFNNKLTKLKQTDPDKYIYLINLSNYLGINIDSIEAINNLLTTYDDLMIEFISKQRVLNELLETAKENLDDIATDKITKQLDNLEDTYNKKIKKVLENIQDKVATTRTGEFRNTAKQISSYKKYTDRLIKKLNATFEQDGVQALTKNFDAVTKTIDINTDTYETILRKIKNVDIKANDLRYLKKGERLNLNKLKDRLNNLIETYNETDVRNKKSRLAKALDKYPIEQATEQVTKVRKRAIDYTAAEYFYKDLRRIIIDTMNNPKLNFTANMNPEDLDAFNNLLNKIIDKKVTVKDILAINDFDELLLNLRSIKSQINKVYKEGSPINTITTSFVKDFINTFEEHVLDLNEYLAQFDKLVRTNSRITVYTFQLSKYASTMYLLNNVQTNELWTALSDTESDTRKLFKSLTKILDDADLKHASKQFNDILQTVDTTNNLLKNILDAEKYLPNKLTKQHKQDITTLIFNVLFDRSTIKGVAIDSSDSVVNNLAMIMDKIDEDLTKLNLFKNYEYDSEFQEQVYKSIEGILSTYLNEQLHIANIYDMPVSLFQTPDELFIDWCSDLGTQLEEIIDTLNKKQIALNDINNIVEVVTSLAGNQIKITETDLIKIVNHEDADVILNLLKKHPEEESIARAITNAFREIGDINDQLQGSIPVQSWLHNLDGTRKQLECVTRYLYKNNANDAIKDILLKAGYSADAANAYYYNALSRDISLVKLTNKTDMTLPIFPKNAPRVDTNNLTAHLSLKYAQIKRMAFLPNDTIIENLRQGLIKFFNRTKIDWAPENIESYFSNLNAQELYAWKSVLLYDQVLTKPQIIRFKNSYALNFTPFRKVRDRVALYVDPDRIYNNIEELLENSLFNDSAVYEDYTSNVVKETFGIQTELYKQDFMRFVKDPETLGTYKNMVSHYINKDVQALYNLIALDVFLPSFDDHLKPLTDEYTAAAKEFQENLKPLKAAKRNREFSKLDSFIKFTPAQKRTYIDKYTDGVLLLVMAKDDAVIKQIQKDLDTVGLKFFDLNIPLMPINNNKILAEGAYGTDYLFVIRRVDNSEFNHVPLNFSVTKDKAHKKLYDAVNKVLESNRNYIPLSQQDLPVDIMTGDVMNADVWDAILNNKKLQEALGDSSIQKTYRKFGENGIDNIYKLSDTYLQTSILGDNAYNKIIDYLDADFKAMKVSPRKKAADLVSSIFSGSVQMIKRTNNRNKYEQLFFNDDFSFRSSHVQAIFKDATDDEIRKIFKQGSYDAVVLKETKVGRHKAFKIAVENRQDLEFAIQQNAILVPHDVYRNIVLTINKKVDTPALLKFYNQTVTGTFKQIYMTSVGTLFRNTVDTLITKNAIVTGGGLKDIIENFQYEYKALKDIQWYDEINAHITKEANGAFPNYKNVTTVLKTLSAEDQLRYKILDLFEKSGAVDGLSSTLDNYMTKLNITRKNEDWADYVNRMWFDTLNKVPSVHVIRNTNELVEKTGRLGLLYRLMDAEGFDFSEAVAKVFETHFDYQVKGPVHETLEKIFWFSTFPINNFMFYLNNGFEGNAQLLRAQLALMRLSWNTPESDWEDVKNSDYLRRNALSGNLRIKIGGKTIILKTGLSIFDFFKLLMNPFEEVKERLNPFLAVLFGERDIKDLNPLSTLNSRASTVKQRLEGDQQKSLIPSLYAIAYPKRQYFKKPYSRAYYSYARSSSHWRPKYKKLYSRPSTKAFNAYKKVYQRYNRSKYYVNTDIANIRPYMINSRRYNRNYAKVKHYYRHSADHVH